jgi:release factor glutamine methyltransferase
MCKSATKAPKIQESSWTILKLLQWTTSFFTSHKIEGARASAEILLANALEIKRLDLYLRYDQPLSQQELSIFKALIKRRLKREPVAYITGNKEFWSLDLDVTKEVLIPRPDTECLVEQALEYLPGKESNKSWNILELGTGSGAIILSMAAQCPQHRYFASDRSENAIRIAKGNAKKHDLSDIILFLVGDWFCPMKNNIKHFDMVVSNPPYIPNHLIAGLEPEIALYEPRLALDGGKDGLDSLRTIINQAPSFLKPTGYLILEIGYDQKHKVSELVIKSGKYKSFHIVKDFGGHDRVAILKTISNQH